LAKFESSGSRVDLINSISLIKVFGINSLERIRNFEGLITDISSICVILFCKAIDTLTISSSRKNSKCKKIDLLTIILL